MEISSTIMGEGNKKIATIGVSSLLLVAMVVAVTVGVNQHTADSENNHRQDVSTSVKAIQSVCEPTDYKEACVNGLTSSAGNSSDPKELIGVAFQVAIKQIEEAARNSTLLQELQNDPRTKEALENCKDLADSAVNDLKRSFHHIREIDGSKLDDLLGNLKTWLSGAITYQETCLDGFENTTGDAGEKMRHYLEASMHMSSNGLAMVTSIYNTLASLNIQGFNRRLLSQEVDDLGGHDEFPHWVDSAKRKILTEKPKKIKPDVVVAKDGSGKYKTVNEALKDIPKNSNKTFVLYIKQGVYHEKVQFNRSWTNLMVVGDGPKKTRITGKLNYIDGVSTFHTATVVALGDNFIAKDIGFENTAGPEKHQAVALRVGADKSIFYNCQMDGYQDTLYAHTYRQFYRDCVISGTIDFIFGDSAAVFQNCTMVLRKPMQNQANIVTAQGRKDRRQPTGLILQNCSIVADPEFFPFRNQTKNYLGRPWKEYSRTIIMESFIDDLIHPDGWMKWNDTFALNTCFYSEFNNRGPASSKLKRVQWRGVKELKGDDIQRFLAPRFIDGDRWIPKTGVPYNHGLVFKAPAEEASDASNDSDHNKSGKDKDKEHKDSEYEEKSDNSSKKKKKEKEKKKKEKDSKLQAPAPAPGSPAPAPALGSPAPAPGSPAPGLSYAFWMTTPAPTPGHSQTQTSPSKPKGGSFFAMFF
ncbi:pectinesterase-like [Diospyros lotus]|uniref:pectinesterase-like n=1 Tax=Diospyros lotus TaxID=55363 RepID=UPI002255EAD5|nr:pectinesterase-like [Diospyros lotus]